MDILDTIARLLGRPPAHEVVRHDLGWTPTLRTPKRLPDVDSTEAIQSFWAWWAEAAPKLNRIDTEPPPDDVLTELDGKLSGLHRELAWELGPGQTKKHALTVSPDGVSALRSLTAEWKAHAPLADPSWEFNDVRPPVPGSAVDLELETSGRVVDGAEVQIGVFDDEDHHRLDVWVYHPVLAQSNKRNRWRIAFLLVDAALGEEKVATWLRTITPATKPLDMIPDIRETVVVRDLDGLRARVALREAEGDPTPPSLATHPGVFQVDPRARRWRFPRFDTLVRIRAPEANLVALDEWMETVPELGVPAVRRRVSSGLEIDMYTQDAAGLMAQVRAAFPAVTVSDEWDPGWALAGR